MDGSFKQALTGAVSGAIMADDTLMGALGGAAGGLFNSGFFESDPEAITPTESTPSLIGAGGGGSTDVPLGSGGVTPASETGGTPVTPKVETSPTTAKTSAKPATSLFDTEMLASLGFGAFQGMGAAESARLLAESRRDELVQRAKLEKEAREHQLELDRSQIAAFNNPRDIGVVRGTV